jgi:hypothetical protein
MWERRLQNFVVSSLILFTLSHQNLYIGNKMILRGYHVLV